MKSNKSKKFFAARKTIGARPRQFWLERLDSRLMLSGSPPVAVNDVFSLPQDSPLSITAPGLLNNDTDAEGDALSAILFNGPAHGTLTMQSNGAFDYAPNPGFSGYDSFTYQANDGTSSSFLAAVTLKVGIVSGAPVLDLDSSDSVVVGADFATTFTEDDGAVALTSLASTLADADSLNLTRLTVTIANLLDGAQESLSANVAGTSISSNYSALGVLTLSGADTVDHYLQVLKTVTYSNLSQHPNTTERNISFVANDGVQDSNLATTSLQVVGVNDAPAADDNEYSVNEDLTLTVPVSGVLDNDTDAEGDLLSAVMVDGPLHGSLALNVNGSFVYTPASNFNGSDSFTYRVNDGAVDSNVVTVSINVNPVNDDPVAINDDEYVTDEDTALVVLAANGVLDNDTDGDGDSLTAMIVDDPLHGTVTVNPDGSFTYTPDADFHGTDGFTYVANDGSADSNVAAVTITVNPVNDAPVAVNDDEYVTDEDTPLIVAASGVLDNDTDVDGDSLTATIVDGPLHGSVTLNPDGSFTYTPDADFNGTDGFTYVANDGGADSNVAAVTITVNPVNDVAQARNDHYSVGEDNTLARNAIGGVLRNDTDLEGDLLTAVLVDGPAHGSLTLNPDGSFTYTPDLDFHGTDGFTYVANDGADDSSVAAVTITVNPVNDEPVANDDFYATETGAPLVVAAAGVLDNDTDVEGDSLSASVIVGPANGSVTLAADGSFTYTPNPGFVGSDQFTYQVFDGEADSNVATVTIEVGEEEEEENAHPVAEDDAFSVTQDQTLTVVPDGVLENDTDDDGNPLTAVLVDDALHGTLTFNPDGSFTYTPDSGYVGDDSFTYLANDGSDDSNLATVTITVNSGVNVRPVAVNDVYSTPQDVPLVLPASGILGNDTDANGDALTAVLFKGPKFGTLALNPDGSLTYTPNPGFSGSDSFSYQANDGLLNSTLAAVTINVIAEPMDELRLAGAANESIAVGAGLSQSDLPAIVSEAIDRWSTVAAQWVKDLGPIMVSIRDLPGNVLAVAGGGRIEIDLNAAGRGWFVDATPAADAEFANGIASAESGVDGRVDLLTVVMHELGHLMGLDHADGAESASDLMADELMAGVRKLPSAQLLDAVFGDDD